jgi:hypothetical protein
MGLEHATITNLDTGDRFEVLFNPSEYSLNKDNAFAQAAVPGLSSPLLQFVHGNLRTLEMDLFFDTYEQHAHAGSLTNDARSDVRALTSKVIDLMTINPATHAPPRVLFAWGQLAFKGVLARVSQRFTMFLDSGIPVRAQLQVAFSEWIDAVAEAKAIKRETADYTHAHTVGDGETLSSIAATSYGDPRKWRPIAIANELEDPRRLETGRTLEVPSLPYRDPVSGDVYA